MLDNKSASEAMEFLQGLSNSEVLKRIGYYKDEDDTWHGPAYSLEAPQLDNDEAMALAELIREIRLFDY